MSRNQLAERGNKQMKNRNFGFVSLMLAMMLCMIGCSNVSNTSQNATASNTPKSQTDDKSKPAKPPATFTYFNAAHPGKDVNTNETTIGKKLEEQTGVNFKIEHLVGDINTKIGVMIASGDYPDVLIPDSAMDKVLDAGAFIPLNDLLKEHAPNIMKLYGPYLEMMKAKDGNIYHIPFEAAQGYMPDPNPTSGFWIQRGVLKEFGYPTITTLDEYFDIIKRYKEKHPQINGKDTIGFETLTHDWRFFTLTNPPMHLAGYPNDGGVIVDMKTHEAQYYGDDEITKRYLKKLNEANNQGLFDKEALVANYDQYLAKISSGRVLGMFDYAWQFQPASQSLLKEGDDDRRYIALPIVFDKGTKDQYLDPPTFVQNRGIGISVKAKDPVRIIEYFDNMVTEDNQKLINWGIKGETYEIDANGKFTRTPEQIKKTSDPSFQQQFGIEIYGYLWPMMGNFSVFADGNPKNPNLQPTVVEQGYTDGDRAILKAYHAKVFSDLFSPPDERKWYPAWSAGIGKGTPEDIFVQKSGDLQRKYFPKMILAPAADFGQQWDEYIKEFNKLDAKTYENTITRIVKDRINGKW
jgi:putative aldouronate transport system substrate-binding protein